MTHDAPDIGTIPVTIPRVVALADAQLRAYNRRDTDAFCACFSDDVVVLDADGVETVRGIDAFRERYRGLFEGHSEVHGSIVARLCLPPHVVEHEVWHRRRTPDAEAEGGQVIVRYTERGGRIARVAFLRPEPG